MLNDIKNLSEAVNPFVVHKPHPSWFTPLGTSAKGKLYNGALFQMLLLSGILGGIGYSLGRQGTVKPKTSKQGKAAIKALESTVSLPAVRPSETEKAERELREIGSLKRADDSIYPGFGDRWLMGALPTGVGLLSLVLMQARGVRARRRAEHGEALRGYYNAQREYDEVLAAKLFPRRARLAKPDKDIPGPLEEPAKDTPAAKAASALTKDWTFAGKVDAPWSADVAGKMFTLPLDTLGITSLVAGMSMLSLIGSFYAARNYAEKNSPQQAKLKAIKKSLDARQTHRYIPKLVLPEEVGIDKREE